MLAAMTHPSRVLNLDMKAKLCMPKSYIYIYLYIRERIKEDASMHQASTKLDSLVLTPFFGPNQLFSFYSEVALSIIPNYFFTIALVCYVK